MDVLTFFMFGLFMGVVGGFFVGRARAERDRARFDMRNTWAGRKKYRKG
jgi:hypothetical protein